MIEIEITKEQLKKDYFSMKQKDLLKKCGMIGGNEEKCQ